MSKDKILGQVWIGSTRSFIEALFRCLSGLTGKIISKKTYQFRSAGVSVEIRN